MANHSGIRDSGEVFQIIPTTKKIIVPAGHRIIGAVGDKNSEQLTFKCPKTIDGHDIAGCSKKWVVWENARGDSDRDVITDITVDGEYIYLKWTISEKVTPTKGYIGFAILFEDIENGVTSYSWSTTTCKDCYIVETIAHKSATRVEETIPDGYVKILENGLSVTANGTYTVAEEAKNGKDGYAYPKVSVNVPTANPTLETLTATKNGTYYPKAGNDGFSYATVDVVPQTEVLTLDLTENKTYDETPPKDTYYSRVKATPKLQEKTVTVKANGETITPDTGYCGLFEVTVNVSTEAPRYQDKTAYENNDTIYPDSGFDALRKVDIKIPTETKSVTPSEEQQNVKPSKNAFLGEVVVYPIPDEYVIPTGNLNITSNTGKDAVLHVEKYETVTVNVPTSAKVEQAKTFNNDTLDFKNGDFAIVPDDNTKILSQVTIEKPSNLISENIRAGVKIFGIMGTYGDSSDGSTTTGTKMHIGRTMSTSISALSTLSDKQSKTVGSGSWSFTTTGNGYIYVVVPANKSVSVVQSGFDVALVNGGTFTDGGVSYAAYRTGTPQAKGSKTWTLTVY